MSLREFNKKIKSLKTTHPASEGLSSDLRFRHYSKIAHSFIDDLKNIDDAAIALKKLRSDSFEKNFS